MSSNSSEEECDYLCGTEIMSGIAYSGTANIGDATPFCEKDVLMGRGKRFRRHPGNVRYAGKMECAGRCSVQTRESDRRRRSFLAVTHGHLSFWLRFFFQS